MDKLFMIEWAELIVPTHSIAEMVLRGSVMYLVLFLILRFVKLRQSSTIGIADILVIVVIADAAQNAFSKEYQSLTEGIILVLTIVGWEMALNWLSFRFKFFERLLAPAPLPLVRDGKLNRENMRARLITEEELYSQFRLQGISDVADIKSASLEANGDISVVKYDDQEQPKTREKPGV